MPRILLASIVGVVGFGAYVAAAVMLADGMARWAWPLQLSYFVVAGMLWVVPARSLMLWAAHK